MADGVTSVRLGDLTEAVDREAALARRTRSEMIRFLIEDGLAARSGGFARRSGPVGLYTERFVDCPTPPMGVRYRVLHDRWNDDYTDRQILAYSMTDHLPRIGLRADQDVVRCGACEQVLERGEHCEHLYVPEGNID